MSSGERVCFGCRERSWTLNLKGFLQNLVGKFCLWGHWIEWFGPVCVLVNWSNLESCLWTFILLWSSDWESRFSDIVHCSILDLRHYTTTATDKFWPQVFFFVTWKSRETSIFFYTWFMSSLNVTSCNFEPGVFLIVHLLLKKLLHWHSEST